MRLLRIKKTDDHQDNQDIAAWHCFPSVGLFRVLELVILRFPPLPHLNTNAYHKELIINFPYSDIKRLVRNEPGAKWKLRGVSKKQPNQNQNQKQVESRTQKRRINRSSAAVHPSELTTGEAVPSSNRNCQQEQRCRRPVITANRNSSVIVQSERPTGAAVPSSNRNCQQKQQCRRPIGTANRSSSAVVQSERPTGAAVPSSNWNYQQEQATVPSSDQNCQPEQQCRIPSNHELFRKIFK